MTAPSMRSLTLLLIAATTGCSDSGTDPAAVTYSGTWRGTFGTTDPATVTWTATQTGSAISGPVVVVIQPGGVQFSGSIAGTIASGQLTLTLTVPAGAISAVPGCSIAGTTTTTVATAARIEGDVATTFSSACLGAVTQQATSTAQLRLTRS